LEITSLCGIGVERIRDEAMADLVGRAEKNNRHGRKQSRGDRTGQELADNAVIGIVSIGRNRVRIRNRFTGGPFRNVMTGMPDGENRLPEQRRKNNGSQNIPERGVHSD
jgi:hypothetical protein